MFRKWRRLRETLDRGWTRFAAFVEEHRALPYVLAFLLTVAGSAAFAGAIYKSTALLAALADYALIVTLAAIGIYAYDTHRLADRSCRPVASFALSQPDPTHQPLLLNTHPRNHADWPIACWCDVRAEVCGKQVPCGGFYGGEVAWHLQPYQSPVGVFRIDGLLDDAGLTADEVRAWTAGPLRRHAPQRAVSLRVSFWYETLDGTYKSPRFQEAYYYDMATMRLVLDVSGQEASRNAPRETQGRGLAQ